MKKKILIILSAILIGCAPSNRAVSIDFSYTKSTYSIDINTPILFSNSEKLDLFLSDFAFKSEDFSDFTEAYFFRHSLVIFSIGTSGDQDVKFLKASFKDDTLTILTDFDNDRNLDMSFFLRTFLISLKTTFPEDSQIVFQKYQKS